MQGMVDLHHHLVYGVDDGAQTMEEAKQMLHSAVQQGVSCVVATPHIYPDQTFDLQKYQLRLNELCAYADSQRLPVQILSGAEMFYSGMTLRLLRRGLVPPLNDSWHVLVEFSPSVSYEALCRAAVHIANAGYTMVLAHAERYRCLYWGSRLGRLREEHHIRVQLGSGTVMERKHCLRSRWVEKVMRKGWVDVVASDAHDMERRCCDLGLCAAYMEKHWGADTARRLLVDNPTEILTERSRMKPR